MFEISTEAQTLKNKTNVLGQSNPGAAPSLVDGLGLEEQQGNQSIQSERLDPRGNRMRILQSWKSTVHRLDGYFKYGAFLLIGWMTYGVLVDTRDFVKIKLGPLFVLEWVFLSFMLLAICSRKVFAFPRYLRDLAPYLTFFGWGVLLLAVDFLFHRPFDEGVNSIRVIQHALIFVYPLLWSSVGYWLIQKDHRLFKVWLVLAFAIHVLPNWYGRNIRNVAFGPWLVFLAVYTLAWAEDLKSDKKWKKIGAYAAAALTLGGSCYPFWTMWFSSMQRTTLGLQFFWFALLPMVFSQVKGSRWLEPFKTSAFLSVFFVSGLLGFVAVDYFDAMIEKERILAKRAAQNALLSDQGGLVPQELDDLKEAGLVKSFSQQFLETMQKGEDRPSPGEKGGPQFQARVRRFMWKTAIDDWQKNPVVGIGFGALVPSYYQAGKKNVYETNGMPPINGPHNSYLTILARMGVIGILLFAVLLGQFFYRGYQVLKASSSRSFFDFVLVGIPLNGFLYAILNVGFESPHTSVLTWLIVGALLGRAALLRREKAGIAP